jgi:hypothetical protein
MVLLLTRAIPPGLMSQSVPLSQCPNVWRHDGTLLMPPSCLQYSVDANTRGAKRVSISFDVMFSSFPERLSKPLW